MTASFDASGPAVKSASFWRLVAPLTVLGLAMVSGHAAMQSFSVVQEAAKAELHLSDYVLGLIQGLGTAIPLALLSVPIGLLVDRTHRVRLLVVLAGIWTFGTLLTGLATSGWVLFVARMLTGIGATGAMTAALSIGADYCIPAQRGRAALFVNAGKMIGVAAGFALAGALFGFFARGYDVAWLPSHSSWRNVHLSLAAISAVSIVPLLFLREPVRHEVEAGTTASFGVIIRELRARGGFLVPLFVAQSSVVMADAAAGIWAAPVLTRSYGLKPEQFAAWMGVLILTTGVVGSVIGGFAADRGYRSQIRGGVLIGALVAAAAGVPAALFPVASSALGFGLLLGLLVICGTVTSLVTSTALTVLIPNELRGLCLGALTATAGLVGFGIAPPLVVGVSAMLGGERHLDQGLAIVGVAVGLLSIGGFALAMRRSPQPLPQSNLPEQAPRPGK